MYKEICILNEEGLYFDNFCFNSYNLSINNNGVKTIYFYDSLDNFICMYRYKQFRLECDGSNKYYLYI